MSYSRIWPVVAVVGALVMAACGNDDPSAQSAPTTPVPTPTVVSATPTPTLTPTPTEVSSSTPSSTQTNAWGDDPVEAAEMKVVDKDGYKADLNISIAHPRTFTSLDGLDELDPSGQLRTCLQLAGLDEEQKVSMVTARVVIELYPQADGEFTWPNTVGLSTEISANTGAQFFGEYHPCQSSDNPNATGVMPTQPTQAWFIFAKNLTPKDRGWAKPYPWSTYHVEVRSRITSCKVGRKTKGVVIDTRFTANEGCVFDVTPKP